MTNAHFYYWSGGDSNSLYTYLESVTRGNKMQVLRFARILHIRTYKVHRSLRTYMHTCLIVAWLYIYTVGAQLSCM